MSQFMIILITVLACIAVFLLSGLFFRVTVIRKIKYMVDALDDGEANFRFDEKVWPGRGINRTLNRLKRIFDRDRDNIREQERYYGAMLDHVKTGIMAVNPEDGMIIYSNSVALSLLGVTSILNIRQINDLSMPLADFVFSMDESDSRKISVYNESSQKTLSVSVSSGVIGKRDVKIIALNDISSEMEENESASWTRLIRVLTHEIMNTVTPIASLSDSLVDRMEKVQGAQDNSEMIRDSLLTISKSSRSLIRFVDTYRSLTRIPEPVRNVFYLRNLVSGVISLTETECAKYGVTVKYEEKSDDIILYADEGLISMVMINLIKNACQAEAHKIVITADIDSSERVVISVANDGLPISESGRNEIFVPFYTTKPSGTGIGLSISRQIMRMHNATLRLASSDSKKTVFVLQFG